MLLMQAAADGSTASLLGGVSHSVYQVSEETDDVDPLQDGQAFPQAALKVRNVVV